MEPSDRIALRLLSEGRLDEARRIAEQLVVGQVTLLPAHGLLAAVLRPLYPKPLLLYGSQLIQKPLLARCVSECLRRGW